MTAEIPKFKQLQQQFSGHIKSPLCIDRPSDVDERHMSIYRDLFFKNIMGFLSGGFPVLAEIMGEKRWLEVGRDFFIRHHNKTPYFLEISREFLLFLENEFIPSEKDPVYLYELAHYEWLELFVDVEPEPEQITFQTVAEKGDVLTKVPVLSAVIEGFLYQYPVHQISSDNRHPAPQQSALIVFRKQDDEVGFTETNSFTLQLLALLKEGGRTGDEALNLLLHKNNLDGQQAAYQGGVEILEQWLQQGIIWGVI